MAMRINDQRVYQKADMKMVDLAGGRLVYTVDYLTSAVAPRYLAALQEEFRIPGEVDLVVPGEDDFSSRLPPGYIALSPEYFRAGLRLPLHPLSEAGINQVERSPGSAEYKRLPHPGQLFRPMDETLCC